jgi:serine protease Do
VFDDGYIATNFHVIQDADLISIRLSDGRSFPAALQQADPRSDLAVLHTNAKNLRQVEWGDLHNLQINQWAFACGNPFGLANDDGQASVSYGVVSALGRQMTRRLVGDSEVEYYGNLIETTASINPGNSGGPLFDVDGRVIGVVTAIETGSGVSEGRGFAIPIDKNTRRIIETLKAGRAVRYGFLGIQVEEPEQPTNDRMVSTRSVAGARITAIRVQDGPAARAGLMAGDLVIEFDGIPVRDPDHLVRLVGFTPVGADSVVTYIRAGVKRRAHLTVGDRSGLLSDDPSDND